MREIDLHDDFWPAALAALTSGAHAPGDPAAHLRERWPGLADLLDELVADARREPLLVGVRLASQGRNSRLFAILAGACLARAGVRTLVLDLSPDTRWLEQLVGADFKEGLVDHLRFAVPIERCVRPTALDRFSMMSGGAWFLAGSPLDDAPGFRAALDRLRQRNRAVVVTLPPPLETGDGTGVAALCGALVTVEERDAAATLAGSERAVVRLTGSPEAARELAQLTHRYLGPLTSVIAGMARARPLESPAEASVSADAAPAALSTPASPWVAGPAIPAIPAIPTVPPAAPPAAAPAAAPVHASAALPEPDDELAFLRDFERPRDEDRAAFWERGRAEVPPTVLVDRPEPDYQEPAESMFARRRTIVVTVVAAVMAVAIGVSARGLASDVVAWVLGQSEYEREYPEYAPGQTIALDQGASTAAPLALPADTMSEAGPGDSVAAAGASATDSLAAAELEAAPPPRPGRRVPYSVHVGSYQTIDSGMRVVAQVEEAGLPAFLAPVSLPGKGRWQRVYVGSFADSAAARRALDRLQQDGVIEEGAVRSTPWAFDLGAYPTRAAAHAEAEALLRKGITAYVAGENPVRLYAGAYQTREEAELLARTLEAALAGRTATLILREE